MTEAARVSYPHIARDPQVRAGEPVVEGSRIPVATVVRAHQLGLDLDEILVQLPGLTPEGLHAALLYYFDHKNEIEAIIGRDETPLPGATVVKG